jgi:pectate lyase
MPDLSALAIPSQTENILLMLTTIAYTYTIDAAASVPAIVEAGAGAGKIMGL